MRHFRRLGYLLPACAGSTPAYRYGLSAFLTILFSVNTASALVLNLADIVGGGDGVTGGLAQGINIANGGEALFHTNGITTSTNVFTAAPMFEFVDGVFVPDGGPSEAASITVSSTGLSISGISDATGPFEPTFDHLWNGMNGQVSSAVFCIGMAQGCAIGAHANKGITFDLSAMEAANPGLEATQASVTAAMGNNGIGEVDYYVFVDGVLVASTSIVAAADSSVPLGPIQLPSTARFLTLVTSSRGSIGHDWSFWLNSSVTLEQPPAAVPALDFGAALGLAAALLWGGVRLARRPKKVANGHLG